MKALLLTTEFLSRFVGGTLDFTCLGKEMTAGIKSAEIIPSNEEKIRIELDWSAEIRSGSWEKATPPVEYMSTRTAFHTETEDCGQQRFRLKFKLGDARWVWLIKPPHKGQKITFEMATGRSGTSK